MRLAQGSLPWVLIPLALAFLTLAFPPFPYWVAGVLALIALAMALFFRDPDREVGSGIVSAADGLIQAASADHVVTFLNVHNVHVIRAPYTGDVEGVERFSGPHLPAFVSGAKRNAGVRVTLGTAWGKLDVHMIAGLIARRAVPFVEPGDRVQKGDRIGVIRFGSRVDVELPEGSTPTVEPGARVRAARTRIADPPATPQRNEEVNA